MNHLLSHNTQIFGKHANIGAVLEATVSGVCNQLEPYFPNVRAQHHHWLISKLLEGCKKMLPSSPNHKQPITHLELLHLSSSLLHMTTYDDILFLTMLLTGFHGLMCLRKLTWPDNKHLQDYHKVILCLTVIVHPVSYQFLLLGHKASCFFLKVASYSSKPLKHLMIHGYCLLCILPNKTTFFLSHQNYIWLRANGSIPTSSWFLFLFTRYFKGNVGGHSLQAGGATALAEAGLPSQII